jgi:receptor protein-tyrosine kinase
LSTDSNVIQRAAQRLSRDGGLGALDPAMPLIEAAAAILPPAQPRTAFQEPQRNSPPSQVPPPQRRQESRRVTLDTARLAKASIVAGSSHFPHLIEEFRIIKRPLLLAAFGNDVPIAHNANVVMVTSARPNEGKSFVATNLAISIASERNVEVLLIDADCTNPAMPGILGVNPDRGLFDLLLDAELGVGDVLLRTNFSHLSVMVAGTTAARQKTQSTELLASARMSSIISEIAGRYGDRIVIIDAAPVLASSEPSVLALLVGQIVLVVEAEQTSRRTVEEAVTMLRACSNINLVLNKAHGWLGAEQFGSYDRAACD